MTFSYAPARGPHRSRREESSEAHERVRERKLNAGPKRKHVSVMTKEVVEALDPQLGELVLDATYGRGGHSRALKAAAKIRLISIDADPGAGAGVVEGNFGDLSALLERLGVKKIDKALFDLGWNREQLASGRGFSFMHDEPLNMSYGPAPRSGFTAAEVLNTWSEQALADALFGYGEERYARRIAKAIVARRQVRPFTTTLELVETVADAVPPAYRRPGPIRRSHPATKTFQALRIAVNDELRALEQGLRAAWKHLNCGGCIAVITFHSVEDRVVKRLFASFAKSGGGRLVYKKPLAPSLQEIRRNPASRSAKLRAIEKVCE